MSSKKITEFDDINDAIFYANSLDDETPTKITLSESGKFEIFGNGFEVWNNFSKENEIEDQIRNFILKGCPISEISDNKN